MMISVPMMMHRKFQSFPQLMSRLVPHHTAVGRGISWLSHGKGPRRTFPVERSTQGPLFHAVIGMQARGMAGKNIVAVDGCKVRLEVSGRRDDGVPFMDTRAKGQQQVEFILGQEMFPEFLEKQILGMKIGETKEMSFTAAESFGVLRSDYIVQMMNTELDQDKDIKPGEMYGIQLKKQDKEGNVSGVTDEQNEPVTMTGRVIARSDVSTTINFNHLLAGHGVHFEMQLISVQNMQGE